MRKTFLCLLMALFAMTATLKAQQIVFTDGFESGNTGKWTQEAVAGNTAWSVESTADNLMYPSDVLQGTHRAYLRNTTGETQGYVTRLVSPVLKLDTVYQPIVVFWYANPKWTADRDTLRVLYKTGPKANWKLIEEFSSAKADWTKVALNLPEYNETYQIAFEGKDNLGRGIVLDSVCVRSKPQCTVPHDLVVTSDGAGKATVSWTASWDANEFDFVITSEEIDPDSLSTMPDSLYKAIVKYDIKVDGLQHSQHVELTSGEYFYAYIRSICEGEVSLWNTEESGQYRFRMRATKYIPYSDDFNMDYNGGYISRDPEWTWRTNTGIYTPHINTNLNDTEKKKYSKDGTTVLCFSGLYSNSVPNPLSADKYACVATPALSDSTVANFQLKDYQVRFWSTIAQFTGRKYAHSIIVGAMTDPEDYTTFVPVDTISVWGTSTFQENIVSFANYQGDGVYVAFASDFDTQNYFFIDDMVIERRTATAKVTDVYVNPRDTCADITWKGNAKKYNVLITNEEVKNPDKATISQIVDLAEVSTNSYKTEALEADHSWNRPYFVYVQAIEGSKKSDWSYRYPFVTIAGPKEVPFSYDFEQKVDNVYGIGGDVSVLYPTTIGIFSNDPEYPHYYSSNAYKGSYCLYLTKDPGNDSWITLPMVENLKNKQLMFFLSGSSTPEQAHATVGVMTNPMDINTFVPVSDFTAGGTGYTRCYMNFADYKGEEGVIAIVWTDVEGMAKNTINYIDELTVDTIATCLPPVNIQLDAKTDSVTISWNKSEATAWEYILASAQIDEIQRDKPLDEITLKQIISKDTIRISNVDELPQFGFGNLKRTTDYYFYVRTICGDDVTWWSSAAFKTPCPEAFPFPYKEDFEEYAASELDINCWQYINYGGTGYPKILNLTSGAQSGKQYELWSTGTTHRCVAIMPKVEGNLSDMLLSLDTRSWSTSAKSMLIIGSMGDINDSTTFVPIDTVYNNDGNKFKKVRLDLSQYKLVHNNIAFTSGLGETLLMNSDVMIDNVELKNKDCIEAFDFEAIDVTKSSIDIAWQGKSNDDKWEIKVLKKYAALKNNQIAKYNAADVIVDDTIVSGKQFHVEGLDKLTKYYFYIRTLCGDSIWLADSVKTGCTRLNPNIPNKETFESYPSGTSYNVNYQADCWTTGNGNPSAATTYIPYIYKTTSYASSGTNAYRLYPTAANSPTWIASPEIDCKSMSELVVTFSFYGSSSYWLLPGVMTDPTDLSTFVVLDSIKCQGKIVTMTMDLSEFKDSIPATARYFGWRTAYNAGPTIYLDDVSILRLGCPMAKPTFSDLEADKVRIRSGINGDDFSWELIVTDSLISLDSLQAEGFMIPDTNLVFKDTIANPSKLLTNLTENTKYYAYASTICDDGVKLWSQIEFMTPCKPISPEALGIITFSTKEGYKTGSQVDRAEAMPCWIVGNMSGNASLSSGYSYIPYVTTSTTAGYTHNGNNYLYMYSYAPTSATATKYDGAYAIMPQMDVTDISKYQVSFYARTTTSTGNYNYNLIVGVVTDPSDLNTFVAVDTLHLTGTYEPYNVTFEDYRGDYQGKKGKYIMLLAMSAPTVYCYAYVSEVSVTAIPTCRPVASFTVDSIAEDLAVVSWKGYTDSYRMLLSDKALSDAEKPTYDKYLVDSIVTTSDSLVLKDLTPSTQYYVYAQGICGEGDSTDISMAYAYFKTECPVITGFKVPYYNDFDHNSATGTGKRPDCWEGVQLTFDTVGSTQTYPYVYSVSASSVSTPYVLYMYSYGYWNNTSKAFTTNYKSIAVAPKVQGNLADYMVSFYAKKTSTAATYGSKLLLGYVTDASQHGMDSTFVKITEVEIPTTTQTLYQIILSDYVSSIPEGARLALKDDWTAQGMNMTPTANTYFYAYFYLDNFKIGMPPTCFPPKLEPGATSMTTADVNIIPAKEGNNKWQLVVIPDSVYTKITKISNYLDTTKNIINADSANFVISGLAPGTLYQIHARTVCGGEDGNSEWSELPVSTRTKYFFKDGYFFGFEKTEGWEFCQNSTSTTYWVNPAIEIGYEGGSATTSYTSYYPYCMGNTTSSIYAYGPREASDPKNAALRWQATTSYYGGYAVFPYVAEAHDRSFEFKMRCGYGSWASAKDTIAISTNYACQVEVGTIEKGKGFETYQVLATISKEALPKVKLTEKNDWLWSSYTFDLDSATVATKQMVIRLPKPADSNTRYLHFDDVTLGAPKGYGLVALNTIKAESQKAKITWDSIGGPWNLYVLDEDGDTVFQELNIADKISLDATGLTPQSAYTAVLEAANAPKNTKFSVSSTKKFRTPCMPLEPDAKGEFYWSFDDPNETEPNDILAGTAADTAYLKPGCFKTGTNHTGSYSNGYQWLWQSKGHDYYSTLGNPSDTYNHREIGYDDSFGSLRVYTSSTYVSATVKTWIVLPELHCSYDTMMIEFWGRCFANHDADYDSNANKVISNTYLGASYSKSLVIGTLTDPDDFSTLEVLDTVTYTYTQSQITGTTLVTSDQTGNRYWQKMQVPLSGTNGKYIVLFQPAYGLFFVDDLKVKPMGDNLFTPAKPSTSDVTKSSATLTWIAKHPTLPSVVVWFNQDGTELGRDTVMGSEYNLTGLQPATAYQWHVYQFRGKDQTDPTGRVMFYTDCNPITPDYTSGFEEIDGWRILEGQGSDTYKQTMCWTYGNAGTSALGTTIYNYKNTATSGYARTGMYSLRLYAYSTTTKTYAAMPAMADISAYDTLQVNFWMRPGYHGLGTSSYAGEIYYQYTLGSTASTAEYYYAKSVIVGTMTDPNDPATFVPIDTVTYNGTFADHDPVNAANEYLFQKKKVALTGATGPYVAFMATLYSKGADEAHKSTSDYMWIDDVWFSAIQYCDAPDIMTADEITTSEANLTWEEKSAGASYVLQVSKTMAFDDEDDLLFNDTVLTNAYHLTGIEPNSTYAWRVKSLCGVDLGESEFSHVETFRSARAPFYMEDFRETTLDADWTFATNPAIKVLDSTNVEFSGSNSTTYGWKRITNSYGLHGAHYVCPFYSSSTASTTTYDYYWMISPTVVLDEGKAVHLTANVALTQCTSGYTPTATAATASQIADDFVFMVAISEDGGKTWKKENAMAIAGMQLLAIPNAPYPVRLDLTKYAGKPIKIGLYREATTYKAPSVGIHVGNIRINYFDELKVDTALCQFQDVEAYEFSIDGDTISAGKHVYSRSEYAGESDAKAGYLDTIFTLAANYMAVPVTEVKDTICEGETYTDVNFHGKSAAGLYKRKLQGTNTCDSIVCLNLYVRPRQLTQLEETICQGQELVYTDKFIGQKINRTGVYVDTLSSIHGCDSIIELKVTVVDAFRSEFSAAICEGKGSYYWEAVGKSYTVAGDYTETIRTAAGCDSIVTLHLSYNKNYNETINVTICEGGDYEFGGTKITAAGTYVHTFESVLGCDSVVTLNLAISDMYRDTIKAEIQEGDVYTFYDVDYDEEGTYDIMRPGQGTDCDSLRVLVLTVTPVQAIENVNTYGELVLRPTILNAGETVRADYHFTKADLANLKVEVYDIVGRSVEAKTYDHQPIIIDAFPIAGVYTVRITTGTGLNLVGRVVVR